MGKLLILIKFDPLLDQRFALKQWNYAIKEDIRTNCILCKLTSNGKDWMLVSNIGKFMVPGEPTLPETLRTIKNNINDINQVLIVDTNVWLVGSLSDLVVNKVHNFKLPNYDIDSSPILLINNLGSITFVNFPASVACSLSNTFGASNVLSATLKRVYSHTKKTHQTTLLSTDKLVQPLDDILFDSDRERLTLSDGKIIFWSDFFTAGMKTKLQKIFQEVIVYG